MRLGYDGSTLYVADYTSHWDARPAAPQELRFEVVICSLVLEFNLKTVCCTLLGICF